MDLTNLSLGNSAFFKNVRQSVDDTNRKVWNNLISEQIFVRRTMSVIFRAEILTCALSINMSELVVFR